VIDDVNNNKRVAGASFMLAGASIRTAWQHRRVRASSHALLRSRWAYLMTRGTHALTYTTYWHR